MSEHEAEPESPSISRFPVPPREELPAELRERFAEVEERAGFLPNVFAALSWRPAEAAAFFAMHDALMDKETPGLSKADRELIVVADRKSTRLNSSHANISYAVFCLKKKSKYFHLFSLIHQTSHRI